MAAQTAGLWVVLTVETKADQKAVRSVDSWADHWVAQTVGLWVALMVEPKAD